MTENFDRFANNQSKPSATTNQKEYKNTTNNILIKSFSSSSCSCYLCKILDYVTTMTKYEDYNIVAEDGDSIYSPEFENRQGRQLYINEDMLTDFVNKIIDQRVGASLNKNMEDD